MNNIHDYNRPEFRREALELLLATTSLMNADMASGLGPIGLTETRAGVLWMLAQHGPQTQRELARRLEVSARNVTTLADALEGLGFISREPHPGDRRAFLLTLTEKGLSSVENMRFGLEGMADLLFAPIDGEDLKRFVDVLHSVSERLRTLPPAEL